MGVNREDEEGKKADRKCERSQKHKVNKQPEEGKMLHVSVYIHLKGQKLIRSRSVDYIGKWK